MTEKEKLRDAVVEAARRMSVSLGGVSVGPMCEAWSELKHCLRALEAAERPRFVAIGNKIRYGSGHELGSVYTDEPDYKPEPDAAMASLIARLLNEHFAKEQP